MSAEPKIYFVSDSSVLIFFDGPPEIATSRKVLNLFRLFSESKDLPIINLHPAYCSLLIDFEIYNIKPEELLRKLKSYIIPNDISDPDPGHVLQIKVRYGPETGEDLVKVSKLTGLSMDEVVNLHARAEYRVAFLGFAPGFPYLLGLPNSLHCPRQESPRIRVPTGSVAIAGVQTGIYPNDSPGGWQLIGRTDICLFDPEKEAVSLLQPGDRVKFLISDEELIFTPKLEAKNETEIMNPVVRIEDPGFFSTVQDCGRFQATHLGVSPGGAADSVALRLGNQLVGNNERAAAVEMTMTGMTLTFLKDSWFAITGAACEPFLDQHPIAMWTSLPVCAGQRLSLNNIKLNLRSYLCIHGGLGVPEVMKSKSTFVSGKWGGYFGRALKTNDLLPLGNDAGGFAKYRKAGGSFLQGYQQGYQQSQKILRVTLGPQQNWFASASLKDFF